MPLNVRKFSVDICTPPLILGLLKNPTGETITEGSMLGAGYDPRRAASGSHGTTYFIEL